MEPLHVTAHLLESVVLRAPLMLDALLCAAIADAAQHVPPARGEELDPIEIPIRRAPGGRFHLCSQGFYAVEHNEIRYKHTRPVIEEMARLGSSKIRSIDTGGGPDKALRVPYEVQYCDRNTIEWWCVGDRDEILRLLGRVRYLGRFRGSGKGKLDFYRRSPWTVEPCESWGEGFPVVRNGRPTRPLPPDWPGLESPRIGFACLTFPYWDISRQEPCAIP